MSSTEVSELLGAVSDFLKGDMLLGLDDFAAYNAKIAANVLMIVVRDLEGKEALDAMDAVMSKKLDIRSDVGPVTTHVSLSLRETPSVVNAELFEYLKSRTLKKMEIDNPKYSGYLTARDTWKN